MTFVGFDLHKRYITACALDASGDDHRRGPAALHVARGRVRLARRLAWPGDGRYGSDALLGVAGDAAGQGGAHRAGRARLSCEAHLAGAREDRSRSTPANSPNCCESISFRLFGSPTRPPGSADNCSAAARSWSASARSSRTGFMAISWRRTSWRPARICSDAHPMRSGRQAAPSFPFATTPSRCSFEHVVEAGVAMLHAVGHARGDGIITRFLRRERHIADERRDAVLLTEFE